MIIEVDETNFDALQIYKTLRDNIVKSDGSFIADSPKVVNLLLEGNSVEIKSILATQEYYDEYATLLADKNIPKLYLASKELMQSIVGHKIHHNCMMHGVRPSEVALHNLDDKIIMLDGITSSENVGSIARSAAAFGLESYLLPKTSPHPFNRRALRVSMGYASFLKIHTYEDIFKTLQSLKESGYHIYAAEVSENSTPLSCVEVSEKWVLLMGHEGRGISQEILQICDEIVTIEMKKGVKSFNVGVAASIMLYQFNL
ncbi:TrmH family RNA methyltransferase [Sulfurimonas sp.]